jgi:hypothetical protein
MKWQPMMGSTQYSADKRYCIVRANQQQWVAYKLGPTTGQELGVAVDEDAARRICERKFQEPLHA